jgi:hypothetical protein
MIEGQNPRYTHEQRQAIRERIKKLHAVGLDWAQMVPVLTDEGFKAPNGEPLDSDVIGGQARAAGLLLRDIKQLAIPLQSIPNGHWHVPNFGTAEKKDEPIKIDSAGADEFELAQQVMKSALDGGRKRLILKVIFGGTA